ncbi:TonB-dependent receptor [Sphingomonas sp. SUN019]|uniref:TonB-dependent receptor n=1 Tax=Sphingomonas sp. SUN019 TaxID=2937788 RepID=UPI002164898D|nr:TonB-dependent receptor [Sphingomonas sp. SUN019]UVO49283.1 TonB-dependent receptor [Sphingomonas sp. SUN019]
MKILSGLTVITIAGVPAMAQAQDAPKVGEEVVVTGRGLDASPSDRVVDVVTIDRDRITTNARNRLEGVLAEVAGLQQFRRSDSRSANPTNQGITLRGIGGNASSRALLILDGVPQADPFGGWLAFPAYATDRLGQIRVTRGGGSGYYGPGALAGTVELESATPSQLDGFGGGISYGSRESVEAQGSAALVRDGGFATLSAAYARGDGFIPTVSESRGSIDRAAPYEQASGAVRAAVRVAPDTELQANVAAFTDRRERGTPFTENLSQGADASLRLVGRGDWGWSALAYLQTRTFASSFASIDAARTTATQTLDQYNTPATGIGARIEIAPPLGDRIALRLGADVRAVSGRTQERFTFVAAAPTRLRAAGGESQTYGIFADGSIELGPVTLALGGRLDHWRIANGFLNEHQIATGATINDLHFADRSGDEATGRAGVAWRVVEPLTLRAAAYRGWRLPTLNELYRPFRVGADATAANAALDPERLTGYEFGATLTPLTGVRLAATWFDNHLDDAIGNVTIGRGPGLFPGVGFVAAGGAYRVRQNLDAVRSKGIEVDAEASHGQGFARASWSHVTARVDASGLAATLDGLIPAQTPRDMVSGTLGWRKGTAVISGTVRHVARQFDDDQNSRILAAATTFDAYAALPIARGFAIEARAENIGDARVEAGISGANIIERATPRTLWIGVRYGG